MSTTDHRMSAPIARRIAAVASAAGLLTSALAGCSTTERPGASEPSIVELAAASMSGSFSSAEQSLADPEFLDIRLEMTPIWRSRADGPWLYVEQAAAAALEKPYRQRVYRLVAIDADTVRSDVYTLPGNPLDFAGAWKTPAKFDSITPEQLQLRDGCSITLARNPDGTLSGSTDGRNCPSDLRGATYATSTVTLTPTELVSWDQGFDASGRQVWGAVKGGYVFKKMSADTRASSR